MAKFGDVDLRVEDRDFTTGAIFRLSTSPFSDHDIAVSFKDQRNKLVEGSVHINGHDPHLLVRLKLAMPITPTDLLQRTIEAAQRALDIHAVTVSGRALRLDDARREQVLWWRRSKRVTVRYTTYSVSNFDMPPIQAHVLDSNGQVIPSQLPIDPNWHMAFRFYRLSQTSADVLESYRNLWLAFEALLSTAIPIRRITTWQARALYTFARYRKPRPKRESETQWLRRALLAVRNKIRLSPPNEEGVANPDKVFFDRQYPYRNSVFHAKKGRQPRLPGSTADAMYYHDWLFAVVRQFLATETAVRLPGGGMTPYAWGAFWKHQTAHRPPIVAVSEDPTPFESHQDTVNPAGLPICDLTTEFIESMDIVGYEHGVLGSIDTRILTVNAVRSIGCHDGAHMLVREIIPTLTLEHVDKLQMLFALVLENKREPVRTFPS